jgi:predicted RNA-binding Zn ribbon-like protein
MVSREIERISVEPEAELLVAFLNTRDLEEETDSIGEAAGLRFWIAATTGKRVPVVDGEDHGRLLTLRESLRALLRANNGGKASRQELAPLREAAERCRYRPEISPAGRLALAPDASGVAGFEARLLLAVERIQSHGAWPRLKTCTDEGCQWAFYDSTRNRSRTWCSMEECGNRQKTRRYRERRSG